MVDRVAQEMAKRPSIDGAAQELVLVLEIIWDRLEDIGVVESDLDRECSTFAQAAWSRWQQLQQMAGAV
jgi:hypothetical protein